MTFDASSSDPDHWVDSIYTWAQIENIPEQLLGFVCFSNFMISIQEDLSDSDVSDWVADMQDQYLAACCEDNENFMNVIRWAASSKDYLEGMYATTITSWAVYEARDLGLYRVAMELLETCFERLDIVQELAEEIQRHLPKPKDKPLDPNIN